MRMRVLTLALLALLVLAGCAREPASETLTTGDADAGAARVPEVAIAEGLNLEAEIVGHAWTLLRLDGEEPSGEGEAPTMTLAEEGSIGGFGGCNRYFGSYTLEGDALKVSGLGSTKRACPPPEMELESRFLERLGAARYLRLEGSTLTLTGDRGDLVFELREAELPAGEPLDSEPA